MTAPFALLLAALLALWFLDRARIVRERDCEAEAKREHRLALAYIASRHDDASLFAGAFLGGHHQIITRHFADFHEFRGREIEREEEEART